LRAGGHTFSVCLSPAIPLTIIMWLGFSVVLPLIYHLYNTGGRQPLIRLKKPTTFWQYVVPATTYSYFWHHLFELRMQPLTLAGETAILRRMNTVPGINWWWLHPRERAAG
jgi:hypothetical protein